MRRQGSIIIDAVGSFLADDGWAIASHIALSGLTSLFPFLIFMTALAGVFDQVYLTQAAAKLIFGIWPEAVAKPIAEQVNEVLNTPRGGLLTFGAVLSLYFSSSAIEALRTGLNRAYDVPETRRWYWLRLQSILFMTVASFALLALAFLVVGGPSLWRALVDFAPNLEPMRTYVTAGRLVITAVALVVALVLAHRWLPAARLSYADIAPGVAFTIVCSLGFGEAFGIYLNEFARNYVSTYAGLASVMIALVFLYVMAAIFIFGGELNAAIIRMKSGQYPKSNLRL